MQEIYLGAAIANFRQKQYDRAIAHFETVMRLDPLSAQAPLGLGKIYLRQGFLEKAAEKLIDTKSGSNILLIH